MLSDIFLKRNNRTEKEPEEKKLKKQINRKKKQNPLYLKIEGTRHKSRGKINCPYCPGCPTACTDKWKFSRIHYKNMIRTSKIMLMAKTDK